MRVTTERQPLLLRAMLNMKPIDLYPDLKRLMRTLVGAYPSTDVVFMPGDRAATLEGQRGKSKTWKWKTSYTHSTLHVLVGTAWAAKVWLRLKTPPAGLRVKLICDGLLVTNKRTKFQCVVGDGVLLHTDYRRRIKRVMAEAIAKSKPQPVTKDTPCAMPSEPSASLTLTAS